MLDLDQQHAGETGSRPVLVELVRKLLLDPVVAGQLKTLAEIGFQIGIRRRFPPSREARRKVPMGDDKRIARTRMIVVAPRQQHPRGQIHVATPEFREPFAANLDVLHVFGFLLRKVLHGRHFLVECEADHLRCRRIQRQPLRPGIEVARLACPLLPFPLVGRQLDADAVGASEGLVAVDQACTTYVPLGNAASERSG